MARHHIVEGVVTRGRLARVSVQMSPGERLAYSFSHDNTRGGFVLTREHARRLAVTPLAWCTLSRARRAALFPAVAALYRFMRRAGLTERTLQWMAGGPKAGVRHAIAVGTAEMACSVFAGQDEQAAARRWQIARTRDELGRRFGAAHGGWWVEREIPNGRLATQWPEDGGEQQAVKLFGVIVLPGKVAVTRAAGLAHRHGDEAAYAWDASVLRTQWVAVPSAEAASSVQAVLADVVGGVWPGGPGRGQVEGGRGDGGAA